MTNTRAPDFGELAPLFTGEIDGVAQYNIGVAGGRWFVLLEDLIAHNLPSLFPGMQVNASYTFRVTRDADLDLQEDEADDLLRAIESELRRRRFGDIMRR